jgi:hypothetical protein
MARRQTFNPLGRLYVAGFLAESVSWCEERSPTTTKTEVTMKQRNTTLFAILVAMTLAVSSIHADSHDVLSAVGDAGGLHECAGIFAPVYDSEGNRTTEVVFILQGGYRSELDAEPVNDLWVLADGYWQRIDSSVPAMAGHSMVEAGGRVYAMGGIGEDDWLRSLNHIVTLEIRRIDGRLEAVVEEVEVSGSAPEASFGASAVTIDRGRGIAYVGGTTLGNPLDSDPSQLWEYRVSENRWFRLADLPTDLSNHTAVAARDYIWVFGGESSDGLSNRIYRYDVLTDGWTRIDAQGSSPDPRKDHGAVVAGNFMLIFGGIETPFFPETLDDVWQFDLDTSTWEEKSPMESGLAGMTAAAVPRSMADSQMVEVLIYGGVVDAWSFPLDLSNSTTLYTSDVRALREAIPAPYGTTWVE